MLDDLIFPADDTNTFIAFGKHLLTNMQILVYIFGILGRYILYRFQFQLYNDEKKTEYYNSIFERQTNFLSKTVIFIKLPNRVIKILDWIKKKNDRTF